MAASGSSLKKRFPISHKEEAQMYSVPVTENTIEMVEHEKKLEKSSNTKMHPENKFRKNSQIEN